MKLCVDCMYFIVNGEACAKSQRPPDYVHGKPSGSYSAFIMRASTMQEDCGPEAKHFRTIPVAVST